MTTGTTINPTECDDALSVDLVLGSTEECVPPSPTPLDEGPAIPIIDSSPGPISSAQVTIINTVTVSSISTLITAGPSPKSTTSSTRVLVSSTNEQEQSSQSILNVTLSVTKTTQVTVLDTARVSLVATSTLATTTSTSPNPDGATFNNQILAVEIAIPIAFAVALVALVIFCILKRSKNKRVALSGPNEGTVQPFLVSSNGTAPPPYCKVDAARLASGGRSNELTTVPGNNEKAGP